MGSNKALASIVIVVIIGMLSMSEIKMGNAATPSAAKCKEERRLLLNACKPVVYGRPPSGQCCKRIKATHIECVCSVLTPKLAALIDLNRAIRIVQGCGRRLPRHFKCGSITTP